MWEWFLFFCFFVANANGTLSDWLPINLLSIAFNILGGKKLVNKQKYEIDILVGTVHLAHWCEKRKNNNCAITLIQMTSDKLYLHIRTIEQYTFRFRAVLPSFNNVYVNFSLSIVKFFEMRAHDTACWIQDKNKIIKTKQIIRFWFKNG